MLRWPFKSLMDGRLLLSILLTLGLSLMAASCRNAPPKIEAEPQIQELGEIRQEPIELAYELRNTGGGKLTITKILTSCGCTEAEVDRDTIPAGQSTTLRVKLDPTEDNLYGNVVRVIYIRSNDPDNPEIEVEFRANILKPVATSNVDPELTGGNNAEALAQ